MNKNCLMKIKIVLRGATSQVAFSNRGNGFRKYFDNRPLKQVILTDSTKYNHHVSIFEPFLKL